MNQLKEKSPRPAATGRDEKTIQNSINYNIFGEQSKALISILGQEHIIKMLFQKKIDDEFNGTAGQLECVQKAERDFAQAVREVTSHDLLIKIDESDAAYGAACERQGFFYGVRYTLDFLFGGDLFKNSYILKLTKSGVLTLLQSSEGIHHYGNSLERQHSAYVFSE